MNHPFEPLRSYLNKRCCSVCNVCHACVVQLIEIMTRTLQSIDLHPKLQKDATTTDRQLNHEPKGPCMHQNLKGIIWSLLSSGIVLMIFRKLPSFPKVASLRRVDSFLKNQHMDVHYLSLWRCTNINDVHKKKCVDQSTYAIWQKRMPKQGLQQAPVISLHQKQALP